MYSRFEKLLHERKLSISQFSKDSGITQKVLKNWASGEHSPEIELLKKIADYFNVSLDYLVGKSDFKTDEERQAFYDATHNTEDRLTEESTDYKGEEIHLDEFLNNLLLMFEDPNKKFLLNHEPLSNDAKALLRLNIENLIKTCDLISHHKS